MLPDRLPGSLLLQIGLLLFDLCHCCVDLAFGQSTVVAVAELAGVVPLRVVGGHAAKGSPVEVRGRVCVLPLEKKRHRVVVLPPGTLVLSQLRLITRSSSRRCSLSGRSRLSPLARAP